jgi:hypothetical protein
MLRSAETPRFIPWDRAAEAFEKLMTAKVHFRAVPKKES